MSLLNFTTILISLSLNLFNTHESVEWKFFFVSNINEQHFQCWKTYGTGNPFVKEFFWTDIQIAATINFVVRRLFIR